MCVCYSDLTTLGLNLNSPEWVHTSTHIHTYINMLHDRCLPLLLCAYSNLYNTFASPWADSPCRPQDIGELIMGGVCYCDSRYSIVVCWLASLLLVILITGSYCLLSVISHIQVFYLIIFTSCCFIVLYIVIALISILESLLLCFCCCCCCLVIMGYVWCYFNRLECPSGILDFPLHQRKGKGQVHMGYVI